MKDNGLTPVIVEWHDAHVGSDGWQDRTELVDDGPCIVHSCGFLINAEQGGKENHISLVATWSADDMVHSVFHIPVQMVQRVDVLVGSHELANASIFSKTSSSGG